MLTAEIVRELLDYNPDTGILTWKVRDRKWFKCIQAFRMWNTRFSGTNAGTVSKDGITIHISRKNFRAHRVAWLHYYGNQADGEIDHINHHRNDNRIENLRIVTHGDNCKNLPRRSINTSGASGVYWNKADKRWCAVIGVNCRRNYLGSFKNKQDAIDVRKQAEIKYGYHPNHDSHS